MYEGIQIDDPIVGNNQQDIPNLVVHTFNFSLANMQGKIKISNACAAMEAGKAENRSNLKDELISRLNYQQCLTLYQL
jgi:hypothetical protein